MRPKTETVRGERQRMMQRMKIMIGYSRRGLSASVWGVAFVVLFVSATAAASTAAGMLVAASSAVIELAPVVRSASGSANPAVARYCFEAEAYVTWNLCLVVDDLILSVPPDPVRAFAPIFGFFAGLAAACVPALAVHRLERWGGIETLVIDSAAG